MNIVILFWLFIYLVSSACVKQVYRKEVRDMSPKEWQDFVNAFVFLRNNGRLAVYVNWHIQAFKTFHWNAKFLPFHRTYILEFENELVKAGAPFLPFWNWTFESQNATNSPLLTSAFFGQGDGRYIINGPFNKNVYTTTQNNPLVRQYKPNSTIVFYAQSLIDLTIMVPDFSEFSKRCEIGPHASIHTLIGGISGHLSRSMSPEDPIFWCHHAFIDKLWIQHQTTFGYQYSGKAFNTTNTLNDTIGYSPWTKKVSDVLYYKDLCVEYIKENITNMGVVNTTIVSIPDSNIDWLVENSVNITFDKTFDKKKSDVDKINHIINNNVILFIILFIGYW